MKQSTKSKIKALGFANMGDHFSLHNKNKTVTITERKLGSSTMLEVLVTVKTRQLNSYEKETLSKIAVMNREHRLESINIGEQTSLLLSVIVPEEEAASLDRYINDACASLSEMANRIVKAEEEERSPIDICS